MPIPKEALEELALSEKEYALICEKLGRKPNALELGLFGSLWSEHCGYKHSKLLLKKFPNKGAHVLVEAGQENAGAIDIGQGITIVFKIESHNHPSAVEPFQGAATGVGGIVRDIFTMGARPIALLNSLRFGPADDPKTRHLFHGVVAGISWYGNCIGVPDVAGEIYFEECYARNPLVNAMCIGILDGKKIVPSRADKHGGLLVLIGADTGRDGIHGTSGLASKTFIGNLPTASGPDEMRSTVQVGNPFLEKVLIESCLEISRIPGIIGMQDLGAAGLTSSLVEMAHKGGTGVEIDVSLVPRRGQEMTPYEVMLSESQERMVAAIEASSLRNVKEVCEKWDIPCVVIGKIIQEPVIRIKERKAVRAETPIEVLAQAPRYTLKGRKPRSVSQAQKLNPRDVPALLPKDAGRTLLALLASPNIRSRRSVWTQYDHQVGTNTVVAPGEADAAVLRVKKKEFGIAASVDGNGRLCFLNPRAGGAIAVAEACRNLVCAGAKPLAITDCLNFGNPEKPSVAWQMKETVRGMAEACRALSVPVISGNVSLYNESGNAAIYPTPIVGAVGKIENLSLRRTAAFKNKGDVVFLAGSDGREPFKSLGGSEYLKIAHGMVRGNPSIDLVLEQKVQRAVLEAIRLGIVQSAHDCSNGGLAVALAECCILGNIGFSGVIPDEGRLDAKLFGEAQSRIIVSASKENARLVKSLLQKASVPWAIIGRVGGKNIRITNALNIPLKKATAAFYN